MGSAFAGRGQSISTDFYSEVDGNVDVVLAQPDGDILIGGRFSTVLGVPRHNIARFNSDGTLDTTFRPTIGDNRGVDAIAVQADGKILVAGTFVGAGGQTRDRIIRIDAATGSGEFSESGPTNDVYARPNKAGGKVVASSCANSAAIPTKELFARLSGDASGPRSPVTRFDLLRDRINSPRPNETRSVSQFENLRNTKLRPHSFVTESLLPSISPLDPILGHYPNSTVLLNGNTAITPNTAPANTTSICVSTSTNFNGELEGDPTTGVVRVTNAHPTGTYHVRLTAFENNETPTTRTFTLHVTPAVTCNPLSFRPALEVSAGAGPWSVAIGDFNRDGKQDIAIVNFFADSVSVLLGDGTGGFSPATNLPVGDIPVSVAVADLNGDGKEDIAVANVLSNEVSVLLGDGAGNFGAATNFHVSSNPDAIAVADLNGDGKQDIVTANATSSVSVLLGDGTGNFAAATNFAVGIDPLSMVIGDFNDDGYQDIAVANWGSNTVSLLRGDGSGNFSSAVDFAVGDAPLALAMGDFNHDGKQDLAVANRFSNNIAILSGDGAGGFSLIMFDLDLHSDPNWVVVGDFNGDGNPDLAVANDNSTVSILSGNGAGSFGPAINFLVGSNPFSVAVADFNGDGKQDLVTANEGSDNASILVRTCLPTPTPAPSPTPPSSGCASGHGYWQNHPSAWCMETIAIGCTTYTQSQAIGIIRHSCQDKTYLLAQELIAAKLNLTCHNSNLSCVSNLIATADAWLCDHPVGSGVNGNSVWNEIKPIHAALEKYNNGKTCAPSCSGSHSD